MPPWAINNVHPLYCDLDPDSINPCDLILVTRRGTQPMMLIVVTVTQERNKVTSVGVANIKDAYTPHYAQNDGVSQAGQHVENDEDPVYHISGRSCYASINPSQLRFSCHYLPGTIEDVAFEEELITDRTGGKYPRMYCALHELVDPRAKVWHKPHGDLVRRQMFGGSCPNASCFNGFEPYGRIDPLSDNYHPEFDLEVNRQLCGVCIGPELEEWFDFLAEKWCDGDRRDYGELEQLYEEMNDRRHEAGYAPVILNYARWASEWEHEDEGNNTSSDEETDVEDDDPVDDRPAISQLPFVTFADHVQGLEAQTVLSKDYPTDCPICKADYEPLDEIIELECKHFYHRECLSIWLARKKTCPICRAKVRVI